MLKFSKLILAAGFFVCSFAEQDSYTPCPILGPRYPKPNLISKQSIVQQALANLTTDLDALVSSGGGNSFTQATPNTTTFSIALFDADETSNVSVPYFWEYHHIAPSCDNIERLDVNSLYNIGGLSQVLTVYTMLSAINTNSWYEPVTRYVPELTLTTTSSSLSADFDSILLIDLATQLANIARDAAKSNIPDSLLRNPILPPDSTADEPGSIASVQGFLNLIGSRQPIYQPATTPVYSDAAFQLLAVVLERISGKTFEEAVKKHILNPLNISTTTVGTPYTSNNAIIPVNETFSGWKTSYNNESALEASTGMFSNIFDLSTIGQSILRSTLLSVSNTNRWLKPHSYTSNPRNGVGMPFDIYVPSLSSTGGAPAVPIFTKLGSYGLYSPYLGLVPDFNVGFVILSADTEVAADLNAYADIIAQRMIPALETSAARQAAINYGGLYASDDGTSSLRINVDGLSGLSVVNWTAQAGESNVTDLYAELYEIPPATLDLRLYPTNLGGVHGDDETLGFRAIAQNKAAPIDAGTPTCVTWETSVDIFVHNGYAIDQFVFKLLPNGTAFELSVPALNTTLRKKI